MKTNPLAVLDPHRFVSATEQIYLATALTAYLVVCVGVKLSFFARIVPVIVAVEDRVQAVFKVATKFVPPQIHEVLVDTIGVGALTIFFEENLTKFIATCASLIAIALMLALSVTLVADTVLMKQRLWRPFARKRLLAVYGLVCVLTAFGLVGCYLLAVYAAFFAAHVLFNLLFMPSEWSANLLSFGSFVSFALAPCDAQLFSVVLYALLFFTFSVTIYNVFYVQEDVFGEKNQEGLTGDQLRNTLRFSRSLCAASLLVVSPSL